MVVMCVTVVYGCRLRLVMGMTVVRRLPFVLGGRFVVCVSVVLRRCVLRLVMGMTVVYWGRFRLFVCVSVVRRLPFVRVAVSSTSSWA